MVLVLGSSQYTFLFLPNPPTLVILHLMFSYISLKLTLPFLRINSEDVRLRSNVRFTAVLRFPAVENRGPGGSVNPDMEE